VRKLAFSISRDQCQPLSKLASEVNICHNTTQAYLHRLAFGNHIAPKKAYLGKGHKVCRLVFAQAQVHWLVED
jgi:hypothetical protein